MTISLPCCFYMRSVQHFLSKRKGERIQDYRVANSESFSAMACVAKGRCPMISTTVLRTAFRTGDERVATAVIQSVKFTAEWAIFSRSVRHFSSGASSPF